MILVLAITKVVLIIIGVLVYKDDIEITRWGTFDHVIGCLLIIAGLVLGFIPLPF